MLRRRILTSAMASVMAIGSVAVVASAEETAAATTQMKTKADLEAYVKSFDSFRSKEINDYASKSGERFLDALEYADVVIDDAASTVDDYTVAYQMVTATYKQLKVYTAEELSALIKANKSKYETNNIYNDSLNDAIYKNEDGKLQWDTFVAAYEDAEDVLNSKDSRIISDAYEALEDAVANLALKDTVTKAQYRAALKSYEQLKQKVYDYDTWRRGTLPGWVDFKTGDYWKYNGGTNISFGALYSALTTGETNGNNGWYDQYAVLDAEGSVSKTSDDAIVTAYKNLLDAVDLMSNWSADDTNRASKSSVNALINDYRGVLVYDYHNNSTGDNSAIELYNSVLAAGASIEVSQDGKFVPSNAVLDPWEREYAKDVWTKNYAHQCWTNISCPTHDDTYGYDGTTGDYVLGANSLVTKMTGAAIKVKATDKAIYIPVDKDGLWTGEAVSTSKLANNYKLFAKNAVVDLAQFISVNGFVKAAGNTGFNTENAATTTSNDDVVATVSAAVTDAKAAATNIPDVKTSKLAEFAGDTKKVKAVNTYFGGLKRAADNYVKVLEEQYKNIAPANTGAADDYADVVKAYRAIAVAYDDLAAYLTNGSELSTYQQATGDWALTGTWATPNLAVEFADLADSFADVKSAFTARYKGVYAANTEIQPNTSVVNNFGTQNNYIDAVGEYIIPQNWMMAAIGNGKVQATVNASSAVENVQVRLDTAMDLAELYLKGDKEEIKASTNPLYDINTTDEIAKDSAKASTAEWTIVYRYLKYALADKYDLSEDKYTKADVVELLEKSYDLAEKTGDADLFEKTHTSLVAARKNASDWVASANKDKKYKDGKEIDGLTATTVYENLDRAYQNLTKDYEAFKYSFGEIYNNLSAYAEMIDEGDLVATDELKKAMEETAYRLSIVGSMENDIDIAIENDAYDADRKFLDYNRVYTKGTGDGWTLIGTDKKVPKPEDNSVMMSHYNLRTAYETLQAEVAKQTEVKTLLGDVNGDGVVNALDASAILKAVVNNTVIDVAVGDYNADGAVNALDASAILKFVVSQA